MDPQVSPSFIPKKNLETSSGRRGIVGILLLLTILMFLASLIAAGAVFAYEGLLKRSIENKKESLALNEKAYDPGVIQELIRVDTRINEAKLLLQKHVAPSALFAFLSMQTLERVQFTDFDYVVGVDGEISMQLKGLADTFSTVALQSDQFGASKLLKDVVFSDVNIDSTTGKVGFSVTATIVPSLVLYSNALTAAPVVPPTVEESSTPAPPEEESQ